MSTLFHEKPLSDYALPETLISVLGLKDQAIGARIIGSKYLAHAIEASLVPPLDDLPLQEKHASVVEKILASDIKRLHAATRIIAVLTQSWHFRNSASGKTLRLAVEFSGSPLIVDAMREFDLPIMENLPPLKSLDKENLEIIAKFSLGYLLGMVPKPQLLRFAFMHPIDAVPSPLEISDSAQDIELFTALAGAAFYMLDTQDADATD
jgi:hypothetical protein